MVVEGVIELLCVVVECGWRVCCRVWLESVEGVVVRCLLLN